MIDRATMIGEAVLNRFHIDHRLMLLSKGALFFWAIPDGTFFDLFLDQRGPPACGSSICEESAV